MGDDGTMVQLKLPLDNVRVVSDDDAAAIKQDECPAMPPMLYVVAGTLGDLATTRAINNDWHSLL